VIGREQSSYGFAKVLLVFILGQKSQIAAVKLAKRFLAGDMDGC
jgi:hypothetical protein